MQWRPIRRSTIKLRVVTTADEGARAVSAPPAMYLGGAARLFVCGHCELLLATASVQKLPKLFVHCNECDALNVLED